MSEPQETRKPNRFRITSIIIAIAITCFMIGTSFIPSFGIEFSNRNQRQKQEPVSAHIVTISPEYTISDTTSYEAFNGAKDIIVMHDGRWLAIYTRGPGHGTGDGGIFGVISSTNGITWGVPFAIINQTWV